jgi:cellobiose phosphorylase
MIAGWRFVDPSGDFLLPDPQDNNDLYFPLVNEAGLMSSITPMLRGDIKTDQNHFLMTPVSVLDLYSPQSARNFWVYVQDRGAWSATGNSAEQIAQKWSEPADCVTLQAGFLWHKVTRESSQMGLRAEITNFVPSNDDRLELMQITLTNVTTRPLALTPIAAIPIFGRSADNLRDHRHVTSLLHRVRLHEHGVLVRPSLSFDERGHQANRVTYAVLGTDEEGAPPDDFCPNVEEFIGEGGSLDWPESVVKRRGDWYPAGATFEGTEAIGALRFQEMSLDPAQSKSYIIMMAVIDDGIDPQRLVTRYGNKPKFDEWLQRTRVYWQEKLGTLVFKTFDSQFDLWLKWVRIQPILRRQFGNSFLPHHDYGRGGRGWRDLWQDCLALLVMEPGQIGDTLLANYGGVRIDGSNGTIIGRAPGEFVADRNNLARIWMDHGAWPFLTTKLYIDQSGDLAFLLQEQTYFRDQHIDRSRGIDAAWQPEQGTRLLASSGQMVRGTVLEHILLQHLVSFFNVGAHNNIKLEDADWNDGMDMAAEHGECVAFSSLYASNLRDLSRMTLELERTGVETIELADELMQLLDTLNKQVVYDSVADKQTRLQEYLVTCRHGWTGNKSAVRLRDVALDLGRKSDWMYNHLRSQEWIQNREGYAWFNGYYDNDGERVEGDHRNGVRMTLTGQVFALLGGVATDEQARQIVRSVDHYLLDPKVGGVRLNTDFGEVKLNLGRCFGFAYGTKENGAMFSHMAVMYAHALYSRGLVREGYTILDGIYQHCKNFSISRIYPGIPEYIDVKGRGAYAFLTGSASWLLLTWLTQAFGVRGNLGNLVLEPKLVREQFDAAGDANVETYFAARRLQVVYHNPTKLDYRAYRIAEVRLDDEPVAFERQAGAVVIARPTIAALDDHRMHRMEVSLG